MSFHVVIVTSLPDLEGSACSVDSTSFNTLTELQDFVKNYVVRWLEDYEIIVNAYKEFDKEFWKNSHINLSVQGSSTYPIRAFYFDSKGRHAISMNAILRDIIPDQQKRSWLELEEQEEVDWVPLKNNNVFHF